MSRAKTTKLYRTFTKGLITEAGYLTYPEDASIDELNTVISRKGNRTRRLGIDFEDDHVLNPIDISVEKAINEFVWVSAAKKATENFLVIQIGEIIHFWQMDSVPVSDKKLAYTINLAAYKPPTSAILDIANNYAQFDAGAGYLFIAHPYVEPLCVEYDPLTQTFTTTRVVIQIRDFEGVYDGLANDEEPRRLSIQHHYNLKNQGWVSPGTSSRTIGRRLNGRNGMGPEYADNGEDGGLYYDPYTGEEVSYQTNPGYREDDL